MNELLEITENVDFAKVSRMVGPGNALSIERADVIDWLLDETTQTPERTLKAFIRT